MVSDFPEQSTCRTYISHMKSVFDPKALDYLKSTLGKYASGSYPELSEREHKLAAQGVLPDEVRFDRRWYSIFANEFADYYSLFYPFTHVTFPPVVRYVQKSDGHFVPWHQDFAYMQLLPKEKRHDQTLTCFVPLDKEPGYHTTLQFSKENCDDEQKVYKHEKFIQNYGLGINRSFEDAWHFNLCSGDALIFGDLALHRTFTPSEAKVQRASLEFRLIKSCDRLSGKDYFCLKSKQFV